MNFAMFLTALVALFRAARHFVMYRDTAVTPAVRDERLDHCRRCVNHVKGNCRVCGCFVSAKTILASEKCPTGMWYQVPGRLRRCWEILKELIWS